MKKEFSGHCFDRDDDVTAAVNHFKRVQTTNFFKKIDLFAS